MSDQSESVLSNWIPLENNPEVLNSWSQKAGLLTDSYEFTDVYGLDSELLAMVPRPVKAVILLFPITEAYEATRKAEDLSLEAEGKTLDKPDVIYYKQTIHNACGTMALLHALSNTDVIIKPDSPLAKFIEQSKPLSPAERGRLLETTTIFSSIHAETASGGQSAIPPNLNTDYHFTCFVQYPPPGSASGSGERRLLELDGRRAGPVDRGPSEDLLEDVAKFVKEAYISRSASIDLSMVALAPSQV